MPRAAPTPTLVSLVSLGLVAVAVVPGSAKSLESPSVEDAHASAARGLETNEPATRASPPSLEPLIARVRSVTVRVGDASGAGGSGTLVSREGHVLTALHVIAGRSRLVVTTPDGATHRARVIARDEDHDLALLGTRSAGTGCVAISQSSAAPDPWVLAAGFAGALEGLDAPSITLGLRLVADDGSGRTIASVHLAPGMSGGPVLDGAGELVGINVAMGRFVPIEPASLAPLTSLTCDAPPITRSFPPVVNDAQGAPDRTASLAVALAPVPPTLVDHTVDLHTSLGVVVGGVVVAPDLVLTLADRHLADARLDRPALERRIEVVAIDDELALIRVPDLGLTPIALDTGRSEAPVGSVVRGVVGRRPGIVGAAAQRPGLLRPFVPSPPGRRCGTLLAMRIAASPDVRLEHAVLAHDAEVMRGELLVDEHGSPAAIHVGHHTSGLGYAVDLDDALARFAAVLRR